MVVSIASPVVVNAAAIDPIDVIRLTDTLGMVCLEVSQDLRVATVTIANPLVPNAELSVDATSASLDQAVLVALTSTTAMIIYDYDVGGTPEVRARILSVSGTTITKNAHTTLTPVPGTSSSFTAASISSTQVLFVWTDSSAGTESKAVILSVSGTTITENSIVTVESGSVGANKCAVYSSTRAIVTWIELATNDLYGVILSLSGNTISSVGTKKEIEAGFNFAPGEDENYTIGLSSTKVVHGSNESTTPSSKHYVLTLNGTTFDVGTTLTIAITNQNLLSAGKLSSTSLIIVGEDPTNTYFASQYDLTGAGSDVLTLDSTDTTTITGVSRIRASEGEQGVSILSYEWNTTDDGVILVTGSGVSPSKYTLGAMTKPASLETSGANIYIALLNDSGNPVLIEFATALNVDGSIVFNPAAGTNIGVECGRFDADVIWVAGNFDGTNVVEKSEDAGSTFVVKDDATIGDVRSFILGPDSDDRILVFDETNGDILETINSGESWTSINAAVTPEVNAIGRLGENVEESVFGNDGGANNSINYSVNSGDDLKDFQTGVYPNANATGIIIN